MAESAWEKAKTHTGPVLGAVIGGVIGGPIGAVLGYEVGRRSYEKYKKDREAQANKINANLQGNLG